MYLHFKGDARVANFALGGLCWCLLSIRLYYVTAQGFLRTNSVFTPQFKRKKKMFNVNKVCYDLYSR